MSAIKACIFACLETPQKICLRYFKICLRYFKICLTYFEICALYFLFAPKGAYKTNIQNYTVSTPNTVFQYRERHKIS